MTDGAGQTAMGNVSVTVENPHPVAVDDTGTTESGSDAVIAVVSNDTGIEALGRSVVARIERDDGGQRGVHQVFAERGFQRHG